ncbi:MAG: UDP-N-acetylmuramate--L-alanine ligase [Actinobacteria bacterium]|nr:UDP-N-acetylmuramate--L-alanine ligase [Actinomycetota bacterium]
MSGDWSGRRLHFVGVGGAGMSGLALVALALGAAVTGSDRAQSPYLERVRAAGIAAVVGHDAANVPEGADVEVVVSTAIPASNPERAAARSRGLREVHRGALLGELSRARRTIAIGGTHGKTTTASMAAHALLALGWDPSYVIGGELSTTGANAAAGGGEWLVVEADESDRSFLELRSEVAVVTNIELDHHTTYASHAELEQAFAEFLCRGLRRVVADTAEAEAFLDRAGIVEAAFFGASEIELHERGSQFVWAGRDVALAVPGAHNVANAAAALTACTIAGARPAELAAVLADFRGAGRRFERLGETASGALVVDDYAHHPTEVRATVAAARTLGRRRVVAAFQPHLFSRTKLLAREFGAALAGADAVCVLDVYPARELAADFPGVSGLLVAEAAADAARGRPVAWAPGFEEAERVLRAWLRAGDVCLVLGAGDVDALGRRLVGAGAAGAAGASGAAGAAGASGASGGA